MAFGSRGRTRSGGGHHEAGGSSRDGKIAPGKRTLTEQTYAQSHAAALDAYPHASAIAGSMGFAPSGHAVIDPEGCAASGVQAFTKGTTTHFASEAPPLRVAAHEAAHLAQHAGRTRDAGLGAERHADAVATAVAAGQSAAWLLGGDGAAVASEVHAYTEFDVAKQTGGRSRGWKDPNGNPLKIADDGRAALSDAGYGSAKIAWALPSEIKKSESVLKNQGARVALEVGAADISGKTTKSRTKHTLSRIEIKDRGGAATTELTDDCGTAMHETMGSQNHGEQGRAAIKQGRNETYTSEQPYQGGYGGAPNNTTPELWFQEILAKEFGSKKTPAELYKLYKNLDPTARAKFDKKYGVNDQAVPKVGQGITTFSQFDYPGWKKVAGHEATTWNYHYATNILTSGNDYITLENYAGHGTTNWFVDMIGPASKGQSFNEMHGGSDDFGTEWSSLVVQASHALEGEIAMKSADFVKKPAHWSKGDSAHPGNLIAKLSKGTKIKIVEKGPDWWQIEVMSGAFTGKKGWISKNAFEMS